MSENEFQVKEESKTTIQRGKQKRDFKGVWIPAEIWKHPHLSSIDKVIYASITIHENSTPENLCSLVLEELGIPKKLTLSSLKQLENLEIISLTTSTKEVTND